MPATEGIRSLRVVTRVSGDKSPTRCVHLVWPAQPWGVGSARQREVFFEPSGSGAMVYTLVIGSTCHFLIEPTVHSDPPSVSDHIHQGPTVPAPILLVSDHHPSPPTFLLYPRLRPPPVPSKSFSLPPALSQPTSLPAMAILGGLFSRKPKSRPEPPYSAVSSTFTDVESLNDESEYDHTRLHPNTIYQNAAASSSKMKLPFRRSKSKVNLASTDMPSPTDLTSTSPQFSTQSESLHSPLTPPLIPYGLSANALSSKSLPDVNHTRSESRDTVKTTAPATTGKKSGGRLFSWARNRKKSKAPPPPIPSGLEDESFNLRSFRHVSGPETPPFLDDTTTTPLELPPARPRPRGDSVASDSSQRVSVAAFREMQARRSQADSPTPQSTSRPSIQVDSHFRSSSPSLKPPPVPFIPNPHNQPRGRSVAPLTTPRTSTLRSSPSNSKSDSDSDSDHSPLPLSVKWRSKSELGHSSLSDRQPSNGPSPTTSPRLRQGRSTSDASRPGKRPPMPVSVHAPARPAAIQSRSPSRPPVRNVPAPAKNARACISPLSKCNSDHNIFAARHVNDSGTSDSSDDSSDDDAPLATLVQPRRPGSALSHASGRSLPPKPLIDIKSLGNSPLNTSAVSSANPSPTVRSPNPTSLRNDIRSPTNISERLSNLTQGLARSKPTSTVVSESTVKAPGDKVSPVIIGRSPPSRSTTAPAIVVPSDEKKSPVVDEDSSPPPKSPTYPTPLDSPATTPSVNATEFPPIRNHRTSLSLDDPTPIKPTPIHHRVPQSGFSVMSRPHYHSTSTSTVPSQKQEGEPLDSIGDFTAAMFSQLDMGFSLDEGRGSLDSAITTVTTKSTTVSATIPSSQSAPASRPTTCTVNPLSNVGREPTPPTRPVLPNTCPPPPPISLSKPTTSGRSRSSTLMTPSSSQPPQRSDGQPQQRTVSRSQPPISRHKRVSSAASTSSESSCESSSSAPSIAPKVQKKPQPQLRLQQAAPRPRSFTLSTLAIPNPSSPTKSSTNNSSSPALNRPPQRPFAMRENSPSSSTGDSSSGRLPITPRDGSEIGSGLGRGVRGKQQAFRTTELFRTGKDGLLSASNSEMGLKAKKLGHRKSVSYDGPTLKSAMRGGNGVAGMTDEERRRERRRSEAKNAIEVRSLILCHAGRRSPLFLCVAWKNNEWEHQVGRRRRRSHDGYESSHERNEPDDGDGDGNAPTEHVDDDG